MKFFMTRHFEPLFHRTGPSTATNRDYTTATCWLNGVASGAPRVFLFTDLLSKFDKWILAAKAWKLWLSDSLCRRIARSDVLWDHRSNNLHRAPDSWLQKILHQWVLALSSCCTARCNQQHWHRVLQQRREYLWHVPLAEPFAMRNSGSSWCWGSLHSHYGNTRTEVDEGIVFNVRQVLAKILQLVKPRITC